MHEPATNPKPGHHLHSTLVRFYGFDTFANFFIFAYLHSTLVRFYACGGNQYTSADTDLHSTLVRFYGNLDKRRKHNNWIYIPHWLDSMLCLEKRPHRGIHIYIPPWLDSMVRFGSLLS